MEEINRKMALPSFYREHNHEEIRKIDEKKRTLENKIDELMKTWEDLSLQTEELQEG